MDCYARKHFNRNEIRFSDTDRFVEFCLESQNGWIIDYLMTNPRTLFSPLRYPGSKRGLVDNISQAIKLNILRPSLYVEPFIGGGIVAINLLNRDLVDRVLMVDLDPWITGFWQIVYFVIQCVIALINHLDSDLNKNAIVPIALASHLDAINFEPRGRVLDLFSGQSLGDNQNG